MTVLLGVLGVAGGLWVGLWLSRFDFGFGFGWGWFGLCLIVPCRVGMVG